MSKKIALILLAVLLVVSLVVLGSCGKQPETPDGPGNNTGDNTGDNPGGENPGENPPAQPTQLAAPVVSVDNTGLATWEAVPNATAYVVSVNGAIVATQTERSYQVFSGDLISVVAKGDGQSYLDSPDSNYVRADYVGALPAPVISVSNNGLASWEAVDGAVGYVCTVNGVAQAQQTETSIQLTLGDTLTVVAKGDGENCLDSLASEEARFVQKYAVTFFKPDGKTVLEIVNVEENGKVTKPQDPTVDKQEFLGWTDGRGNAFDFEQAITQDTNVYASYYGPMVLKPFGPAQNQTELDAFLNKFDGNVTQDKVFKIKGWSLLFKDAGAELEFSGVFGGKISMTPAFNSSKLTSQTWSVYVDGELKADVQATAQADTVLLEELTKGQHTIKLVLKAYELIEGQTVDPENTLGIVQINIEGKDEYKIPPQIFTVTFKDGTTTIGSVEVKEGRVVAPIANPVKVGYIFKEWQKDGVKYEFTAPVTGNLELVAIFEKEPTVVVTYKDGDRTITTAEVKKGENAPSIVAANAFTKDAPVYQVVDEASIQNVQEDKEVTVSAITTYKQTSFDVSAKDTIVTDYKFVSQDFPARSYAFLFSKAGAYFEMEANIVGDFGVHAAVDNLTRNLVVDVYLDGVLSNTVIFNTFESKINGNFTLLKNIAPGVHKIKVVLSSVSYDPNATPNEISSFNSLCFSQIGFFEKNDPKPVKLATPAVEVNETGLASWTAVENATGYVVTLNGVAQAEQTATSIQLAENDKITVVAVSSNALFLTSDASEEKTYTKAPVTPSGSFVVTFTQPDGTEISKVTVKDGETVGEIADPVVAKKEFLGWRLENGKAFDKTAPITADTTVVATYFAQTDVGFNSNTIPTLTTLYGLKTENMVTNKTWGVPFKGEGSYFEFTAGLKGNVTAYIVVDLDPSTGTTQSVVFEVFVDGESVKEITPEKTAMQTLCTIAEPGVHTVKVVIKTLVVQEGKTFNNQGGINCSKISCTLYEGPAPVEEEEEGPGEEGPSGSFVVTFTQPDGTEISKVTVKDGETVGEIADPVVAKKEFLGWRLENGKAFDKTAPITADTTVVATYYATQEVKFNSTTVPVMQANYGLTYADLKVKGWGVCFAKEGAYLEFTANLSGPVQVYLSVSDVGTKIESVEFEVFVDGVSTETFSPTKAGNKVLATVTPGVHTIKLVMKTLNIIEGQTFNADGAISVSTFNVISLYEGPAPVTEEQYLGTNY